MNSPTPHPHYEALDLLKSGYSNSQEVIRFLDTKVAIINAAVTLILGFAVCLAKWWVEKIPEISFSWHKWEKVLFFAHPILLLCVGTFGLVIIAKSANVWKPNHSLLTPEDFTALFPEWDGDQIPEHFADSYLRTLAGGGQLTPASVASEYAIQCKVLGKKLHAKIAAARKLSPWFTALYLAVAAETLAVVFCITWRFVHFL